MLKSRCRIDLKFYLKQKIVVTPLLLVIFSFISTFWSENWQVAIFRSMKLLEFYLLYLWVIFRLFHPLRQSSSKASVEKSNDEKKSVQTQMLRSGENVPPQYKCSTWNNLQGRRGTFYETRVKQFTNNSWQVLKNSINLIILIGIIQSVVGIIQFVSQKSIGLVWLKESIISSDISGVAKIILNGEKYVRSYGFFPHPNILGIFLLFSIFLTLLLIRNEKEAILENKFSTTDYYNVPRGTFLLWWNNLMRRCRTVRGYYFRAAIFIQTIGLIFTFSKLAIFGLIFGTIYISLYFKDKLREDYEKLKKKKVKFFKYIEKLKFITFLLAFCILIVFIMKPDFNSYFKNSLNERVDQINVSRGTFIENPILGVGIGGYVMNLEKNYQLESWKYQPVHNIFILVLNELGVVGLLIIVYFLVIIFEKCKIFKFNNGNIINSKDADENDYIKNRLGFYLRTVFLIFIIIMFFDHYFWDIQQGQIVLWLVLGMLIGSNLWIEEKNKTYPQDKS